MSTLATLPRSTYGVGATPAKPVVLTVPSQAVPTGLNTFKITLTRNAWPSIGQDVAKALLEFSFDGGATWPYPFGFSTSGGVDPRSAVSSSEGPVPQPGNANRFFRATVTLFAPLDSSVLVEGV